MTHDKKWGIYAMVWTVFLNLLNVSSFKIRAKMIGTGNPTIRSKRLRTTVFFNAFKKSLFLNAWMKYCIPWLSAHGISPTFWTILYFLKAISTYFIGTYLNTSKYTIGKKSNTYNCQYLLMYAFQFVFIHILPTNNLLY